LAPGVVGEHRSVPLQTLLSKQTLLSGNDWQPTPGTHNSTVHDLPSLWQVSGVPNTQPVCGLHVSVPLQTFPSLHREFVATCWQEFVVSLHESTVQSTLSAQSGGVPP
jgi:hypothetical protein